MNKQEVINEFNRLVDEGWKKAYHCLLDNNVFIGDLTEQAKLMRPDCERKSLMGAKGTQELRLMNNVGERFKNRGNRYSWKLLQDECWTKDEIDAEIMRIQNIEANAEAVFKSKEYKEYLRLKKKFEEFHKHLKYTT